jgi:hypothetical protein
MTGRPPLPIEQKILTGTYRPGRTLVPQTQQTRLEAANGTPEPLGPLGETGTQFWELVWREGVNWISPQCDRQFVQIVAEQLDERHELQILVRDKAVARDRSGLRELEKQINGSLAALGLNPSDRARLGFGIVRAESKLEGLLRRTREDEEQRDRERYERARAENPH